MRVAVVGLGIFGRALARDLARAGVEVIAIDEVADLVAEVKDEVALAVQVDATDEKELRALGIETADALVACIGENFEANQLVVLLARKLGIKRVLARARSQVHARILQMIGVDEVILPEEGAALDTFHRLTEPSLMKYLRMAEGVAVMELLAPEPFIGRTVGELDLRRRLKVNLLLIRHGGEHQGMPLNPVPGAADVIRKGDVLVISGLEDDVKKLVRFKV